MGAVALPGRPTGRGRQHAEAMIARWYDALRAQVLAGLRGKLARQSIYFDESDLNGFYNQAWHGLYTEYVAGKEIPNPPGWLVTVAYRRAIDEFRRMRPDDWADNGAIAEQAVLEHGYEVDVVGHMDAYSKLRQFIEALRDRLSKRECEAATLCYIQGYSRPEAAELLGIEPKRMEKIMDSVSKKVGGFVRDIESGLWCDRRRSLLNAYAFGVLDPDGDRYPLAVSHLGECAGCRAYVRSVRGLAALVPPVAVPVQLTGGGAAAASLAKMPAAGGAGHSTGAAATTSAGAASAGSSTAGVALSAAGAKAAVAAIVLAAGGAATAGLVPRDHQHPHRPLAPITTSAASASAVPLDRPPVARLAHSRSAAPTRQPNHKEQGDRRAAASSPASSTPPRTVARTTSAPVPTVAQPHSTSTSSGGPGSGELGIEG